MPKFSPKLNTLYDAKKHEHYIEIDDGPFKGICFNFEKIEFLGEDEEGNGRLAFEFDLIFVPEGVILNDGNQKEFETALGEIMKTILEDYVLEHPLLDETTDEDRNADTE